MMIHHHPNNPHPNSPSNTTQMLDIEQGSIHSFQTNHSTQQNTNSNSNNNNNTTMRPNQSQQRLPPPPEPILYRLKLQIEHYFSVQNLIHDEYMLQQIMSCGGQSVPCALIASFPRVRSILQDHQHLLLTRNGDGNNNNNNNTDYPPFYLMQQALESSAVVRVQGDSLMVWNDNLQQALYVRHHGVWAPPPPVYHHVQHTPYQKTMGYNNNNNHDHHPNGEGPPLQRISPTTVATEGSTDISSSSAPPPGTHHHHHHTESFTSPAGEQVESHKHFHKHFTENNPDYSNNEDRAPPNQSSSFLAIQEGGSHHDHQNTTSSHPEPEGNNNNSNNGGFQQYQQYPHQQFLPPPGNYYYTQHPHDEQQQYPPAAQPFHHPTDPASMGQSYEATNGQQGQDTQQQYDKEGQEIPSGYMVVAAADDSQGNGLVEDGGVLAAQQQGNTEAKGNDTANSTKQHSNFGRFTSDPDHITNHKDYDKIMHERRHGRDKVVYEKYYFKDPTLYYSQDGPLPQYGDFGTENAGGYPPMDPGQDFQNHEEGYNEITDERHGEQGGPGKGVGKNLFHRHPDQILWEGDSVEPYNVGAGMMNGKGRPRREDKRNNQEVPEPQKATTMRKKKWGNGQPSNKNYTKPNQKKESHRTHENASPTHQDHKKGAKKKGPRNHYQNRHRKNNFENTSDKNPDALQFAPDDFPALDKTTSSAAKGAENQNQKQDSPTTTTTKAKSDDGEETSVATGSSKTVAKYNKNYRKSRRNAQKKQNQELHKSGQDLLQKLQSCAIQDDTSKKPSSGTKKPGN